MCARGGDAFICVICEGRKAMTQSHQNYLFSKRLGYALHTPVVISHPRTVLGYGKGKLFRTQSNQDCTTYVGHSNNAVMRLFVHTLSAQLQFVALSYTAKAAAGKWIL